MACGCDRQSLRALDSGCAAHRIRSLLNLLIIAGLLYILASYPGDLHRPKLIGPPALPQLFCCFGLIGFAVEAANTKTLCPLARQLAAQGRVFILVIVVCVFLFAAQLWRLGFSTTPIMRLRGTRCGSFR